MAKLIMSLNERHLDSFIYDGLNDHLARQLSHTLDVMELLEKVAPDWTESFYGMVKDVYDDI